MTVLNSPAELNVAEWMAALQATVDPPPGLHPEVVMAGDMPGIRILRADVGRPAPAIAFFRERRAWLLQLPGSARFGSFTATELLEDRVLGWRDDVPARPLAESIMQAVGARTALPMCFGGVEVGGRLWAALLDAAASARIRVHRLGNPQPRWYVDLPVQPDDYWAKFSAKSLKNLRRSAKALEHRIRCAKRTEDIPYLLDALVQVSQKSWQNRRLGKRFAHGGATLGRLHALASIGALRSYVLEHAGRPVAFVHGAQYRGCYFFEETGFDLEFAPVSPGRLLCYRVLQDLLATDAPARLDFGLGDAEYKRFFGNRFLTTAPLLLARRSAVSATELAIASALRFVEARVRRLLQGTHVYRSLRSKYRGRS